MLATLVKLLIELHDRGLYGHIGSCVSHIAHQVCLTPALYFCWSPDLGAHSPAYDPTDHPHNWTTSDNGYVEIPDTSLSKHRTLQQL